MGSLRLAPEVAFAVVGDKKRADSTVRIVCAEAPFALVKSADHTVAADRLQDRPTRGCIPQVLCQPEILFFSDVSEFPSVLAIVFLELRSAAEARATRPGDP